LESYTHVRVCVTVAGFDPNPGRVIVEVSNCPSS
jgi:hypothetical protein